LARFVNDRVFCKVRQLPTPYKNGRHKKTALDGAVFYEAAKMLNLGEEVFIEFNMSSHGPWIVVI